MYRSCIVFVGLCLAFGAAPVQAGQDQASIGISITIVDPAQVNPAPFVPQAPVVTPAGRYPAQPVACNLRYNLCINPQGHSLGTVEQVRATLPAVSLEDVHNRTVVCDRVCYDSSGRIVGAYPATL